MRHFLPVCVLAGAILWMGLGSCELANIGDPIIVSDIEEEFRIAVLEKLSPGERSLQFEIETIEDEPCANAVIEARLTKVSYQVRVSLQDILAPADCIPGTAPAFTSLDAGLLPAGYYRLTIDLKSEVVNEGQIIVRGDRYLIDMETTNGFTLPEKELLRIPENTIWGYVTYESTSDEALATDFQESIAALADNGAFARGYYGHFQVTGNHVVVRNAPRENRIKQFAYGYSGEVETLQQLIDQYRAAYGERLQIYLINDDGDVF